MYRLPFGKRQQKTMEHQHAMGRLSMSTGPCSMAMLVPWDTPDQDRRHSVTPPKL